MSAEWKPFPPHIVASAKTVFQSRVSLYCLGSGFHRNDGKDFCINLRCSPIA